MFSILPTGVFHTRQSFDVGHTQKLSVPQVRHPWLNPIGNQTSSVSNCHFNVDRQAGKLWISILKSLVWPYF